MWSRFLIERECFIQNKKTTLSSFVTCQSGRQFTDDISESFEFHSAKEHWCRFFFNLRQKIIRKARKALLSIYGNSQLKKNILCKLKIGCITWYMFLGRHFYLHRYSSTKRARIILKWTNFSITFFSQCFAFVLLSVFLIKWNARMAPYSRPTLYLVITVADYDRPPASLGQI